MDAQLTIFDVLAELDDERGRGDVDLRRLGDGPELGAMLLMPLMARGWKLHRVRPFAGDRRWLYILANDTFQVRREGDQLADVAVEIFQEASALAGASPIGVA